MPEAPTATREPLEELNMGNRVALFVRQIRGNELPGRALRQIADELFEERRKERLEVAVLLCIIGQLGHGHLAALPPAVERMLEKAPAGQGRRQVERHPITRDGHRVPRVESHRAMVAR